MATPSWIAATPGQLPLAAQVNQFLGTHASTIIYSGNTQNSNTAVGAGAVPSNGVFNAQSFTTSATYTTGRIVLDVSVTGTPPPITYTIQSSASGHPSSTVLASVVVPSQWYTGSLTQVTVPIPGGVLANATTYWIVTSAVGDVSNFFLFSKSTAGSGASTSPDGITWTAQAFGLVYVVADIAAVGQATHTWEDGGLRWTTAGRNTGGQITGVKEFTTGQTTAGYLQSTRALAYSGTRLTGVS